MLDIWKIRGKLMKSVPKFMQGVHRCAMRHALDVVIVGESQGDVLAKTTAWKLFPLIPRMFLFRHSRGGQVSKKVLMARVDIFNSGRWDELVEMSVTSSLDAARAQARRRRGAHEDNVEKRARRAYHMIQLGEVSAGRQALEGASLATGDERTLKALKDPARRPPLPRDPVKSIPPNTEKWLRKCYYDNYNNDTSNETKHETNYSMNNDMRNMHIT